MRKGGVILLVEDDEVDIQAVKRAFKQHRVANTLHVTRDGEQALSYLRNEGEYADRKKAPPPSLVITDLRMPRMDGLELLKILKADSDFRVIPVVVFTSSKEEVDIVSSYANGA
ncbi:MAG: response regulator, partial [Gemmatimonadetes bacterium]|nr:response regulator [Gemmatimonadota bacterium]